MSRLIVKNLPNHITTEKLKDVFNIKGEITDVQLKYTKEGKFRNFGFIGFRTEEQAEEAKKHFNGTCIKTNRITVESCVSLGDKSKPKAWSKYAPDSSAYKKTHAPTEEERSEKYEKERLANKNKYKQNENDKIRDILERHKDDPLFAEFMEVHASKLKKAIWSNDSTLVNDKNRKSATTKIDDEADEPEETHLEELEKEVEEETSSKKKNKKLALQKISDLDYMKSLMKKTTKEEETSNVEIIEEEKAEPKKKKEKVPRNRVLFHVKIHGLPFTCKKKDIKDFFRPLVPFTIRIPRCKTKYMRGFCYVGFRTEEERKKALMKSRSFLSGNRVTVDKYDKTRNIEQEEDENQNTKTKNQEESLKNEETIAESGKIFVRNLPYVTNEDELQVMFEKFGPITEVNLPVDKTTHQSKGFAHVTYMMPEHAVKAFTELDGSIFCGRMLHLLPGKQGKDADSDDENLTFKEKKEKKQKSQSGSSHNWNTLFLGANAVADIVAESYNTTKEKLLEGNEKTSAAVKLALGETQVVANTRKFLEESGVSLDAFNQAPKKRSKTIILIKNLPARTTKNELNKLFEPFGLIARLIMPPYGITALVEFVEPSEARQAFFKLAYSKFKYLPLYLEWAPKDAFTTPTPELKEKSKIEDKNGIDSKRENVDNKDKAKEPEIAKEEPKKHVVEEEPEENTILFVKGLNFETREERVKKHFESFGHIHSVTVAMKKDPYNPGERLSMGYGFVQFSRRNAAENALKNLQGSYLDGKQIELKRSERTGSSVVKTARKETVIQKQTGTKILVRNVAFQANRREIQEIFGAFGEIKALRMPKKMDPGEDRHRGFCFVEYHNNSDSKNAFEALCQSTHLYGRRLVLEWAKLHDDDEMVSTIRKRTAETFNMPKPGGKKSKKAVADVDNLGEDEEE